MMPNDTELKDFLEHGARVFTSAARKLAYGPLPPQDYVDLADASSALTIMLTTRLATLKRAGLITPERMIVDSDPDLDQH